jgi:NADH-quinone oxidoreductase subunit L
MLALAALLTAFYTMRQITMTFLGQPRTRSAEHAHESRWTMTVPLVVLSAFAIGLGWIGIEPGFPVLSDIIPDWLGVFVGSMLGEHGEHAEVHSVLPIIISILLSLGGLFLGWRVYRNFAKRDAIDPVERAIGSFYQVLRNKYYFDEIYAVLFVRPSHWVSETFTYQWLDLKIIDGFLHGIARISMFIGRFFRNFFDLPVVNLAGDSIGEGTRGVGSLLRYIQTGRVQQYMMIALVVISVVGILFYYLAW